MRYYIMRELQHTNFTKNTGMWSNGINKLTYTTDNRYKKAKQYLTGFYAPQSSVRNGIVKPKSLKYKPNRIKHYYALKNNGNVPCK